MGRRCVATQATAAQKTKTQLLELIQTQEVSERERTGRGGVSEEGVAPLPQTLSAGSGLTGVCSAGVFQPLGEHLGVFLKQQELTQNHVGLKKHENTH